MVVSEWITAWKPLMSPIQSMKTSSSVMAAYSAHSLLAVSWNRGVRRSGVGPGASARASCIPPVPRKGRMATPRTMTPMPPSHWVSARQKAIPLGSVPGSSRIEAPVVVNPDAVSNTAFDMSGIAPVRRYGRAPKIEKTNHANPTVVNPCLTFMEVGLRTSIRVPKPNAAVIPAARAIRRATSHSR